MLPARCSQSPCMNIDVNSVNQMGLGPGSCGTSNGVPSMTTGCAVTRSTPFVISYGTAEKPNVKAAPASVAPAPWSRTKAATLRPMIVSVTYAGPRPRSFWSWSGNIGRHRSAPPAAIIAAMEIDIRPYEGDPRAFLEAGELPFGDRAHDADVPHFAARFEADRSLAAYDGDRIVGTAGAFSFQLVVPGATLPAAGVTIVGVHPTHRRRGILRRMMRMQLDDVHARGEPARHPVGQRGEHLPALRLRAGIAEGLDPARPRSERLPGPDRAGGPAAPRGPRRGPASLPARPRRDPSPAPRLLRPRCGVLGARLLHRSGALAAGRIRRLPRRPRDRRHGRRVRAIPDQGRVVRQRSEVQAHRQRGPRHVAGRHAPGVELPARRRPRRPDPGVEPGSRRPDRPQRGRATAPEAVRLRRPVAAGRGRGGRAGREAVSVRWQRRDRALG